MRILAVPDVDIGCVTMFVFDTEALSRLIAFRVARTRGCDAGLTRVAIGLGGLVFVEPRDRRSPGTPAPWGLSAPYVVRWHR